MGQKRKGYEEDGRGEIGKHAPRAQRGHRCP